MFVTKIIQFLILNKANKQQTETRKNHINESFFEKKETTLCSSQKRLYLKNIYCVGLMDIKNWTKHGIQCC